MADEHRETLRFNPNNTTTGTVERVRGADGSSRVLKRLRRAGTVDGTPAHWIASTAPRDWNHWAREADVYSDPRLRDSLRGTGLDMAGAFVTVHEDTVDIWLEDVVGTPGPEFSLADHRAFAAGLGRWQARPLEPAPSWSSRGFLRAYATSRPADHALVDDDAAWEQPLIRDNWPPGLREGWRRLQSRQDDLFALMQGLPRTVCHLDAWPANVIRRPGGEVVLLDWAFAGDGAVGEDLGNYLPDAVLDLFWPADRLGELEDECWAAYRGGLSERGWAGSDRDARLGLVASCVKYVWLLPALLGHAGDAQHSAYHVPADPGHLYRERGRVLAHLVRWAEEAYELAGW